LSISDSRTSNCRPLRIAQVAPLFERVPPKLYGGTERVVSYVTEELVKRGHDVTLFASGDSLTNARLVRCCEEALRLSGKTELASCLHISMLTEAFETGDRFDIIHSHVGLWTFPFCRNGTVPSITTMHDRVDTPELYPLFARYPEARLVSISDSQRRPIPKMNWVGTAYHGLPRGLLQFNPRPGQYLAFIGRIAPEKGPEEAIAIARRSGVPLKIAAKVDENDRDYYESVVKPLIDPPHVEYIGEVDERGKSEFLGGARALLFPIDWPEPFGLAMIEALACGTPVIARPCGSVPEIIAPGICGVIAAGLNELVAAVDQVHAISREQCRRYFEERFTVEKMVDTYETIYRNVIAEGVVSAFRLSGNGVARPHQNGMLQSEQSGTWADKNQPDAED
jgi:glycosyltransferase involved in cell wall biosynthesis